MLDIIEKKGYNIIRYVCSEKSAGGAAGLGAPFQLSSVLWRLPCEINRKERRRLFLLCRRVLIYDRK